MDGIQIYRNNIDEINDLHKGIQENFYDAIQRGLRIGELLIEEKAKLKHGEWIGWIEDNLAFGHTQSRKYMQLFKEHRLLNRPSGVDLELSSINSALSEIRNVKKKEKIKEIEGKIKDYDFVPGKYDVVILDPPWKYGREYDSKSSRIASPFPEQDKEEIFNDCKDFFKDDCVLWLWTTHKFIWQAKELLEEWGFEYKAILIWDKEKMGMGAWLRMQCEFCLLGIKGKPRWNLKNERDIINEARREHSRKPEKFYKMVKDLCDGLIFEYYSREKREGIITQGVEIE